MNIALSSSPQITYKGFSFKTAELYSQTIPDDLDTNIKKTGNLIKVGDAWKQSRLVDFGHTVGQVLEMVALGTEHELTHGESVAVDMAYSTVLAFILGHISAGQRDCIINMLRQCQVPLYSTLVTHEFIDVAISERTKQSMGQKLPLLVGIGKGMIFDDVPKEEFHKALDLWIELAGTEGRFGLCSK